MTNSKCDLTNPNFTFFYCPSYPAAVLFAVLFSFITTGHVYQAVRYRKSFAMVLIMGGIWEMVGYAIRTGSIQNPYSPGINTAQMLLILLAPLWINAFVYMLVGRMIHFFLEDDRVYGIKARKITLVFVIFDITAFVVQGTGGSMSSSASTNTALTGLHIYTAGVALQIAFNVVFLTFVGKFQSTARSILQKSQSVMSEVSQELEATNPEAPVSPYKSGYPDCLYLLRVVYIVTGMILFRNFYRLAEFASGLNNTIIRHEWFAYVFDALPMLAALVILSIFYPGKKLQGARCDFSAENRARKQAKKDQKVATKQTVQVHGDAVKLPYVSTQERFGDERV